MGPLPQVLSTRLLPDRPDPSQALVAGAHDGCDASVALPLPQEHGKRGGTESMVLLAGLGKAAEILQEEGESLQSHMKEMRDRLADGLMAGLTEVS